VIGIGAYYYDAPAFRAAQWQRPYGPVTFRNDSEPYMELAVPSGNSTIEVTVVDINLKAIWDVISRIRIGEAGYAYVVDSKAASSPIRMSAWFSRCGTCPRCPR
jgi:hypothetical protein